MTDFLRALRDGSGAGPAPATTDRCRACAATALRRSGGCVGDGARLGCVRGAHAVEKEGLAFHGPVGDARIPRMDDGRDIAAVADLAAEGGVAGNFVEHVALVKVSTAEG